jgi:hypothetical protein
VAAVIASESVGKVERHEQDACAKHEHMLPTAEIKCADAAEEQVGDDEIQEAPEDVDCGGRQSLSWRFCEGALKGATGDAGAEVREGVGEKCAAEEIGD